MKTIEEIKSALENEGIPFTVHGGQLVTVAAEDLDGVSAEDFAEVEQFLVGYLFSCYCAESMEVILFSEGWEDDEDMYGDMAYCGLYTGQ